MATAMDRSEIFLIAMLIIFANILLDKQIIISATFTALLLMAVGSSMLTIPTVTPKLKRLAGLVSNTQ